MKKIILFAGTIASMLLAFTSCKPEQSELNMDTIPEEAVITGKVMYDAGSYKNEDGGLLSSYMLPASGQTVIVTIPMDDYVSGAQGTKTYTTQVDESGKYRITIPVGMKPLTATVGVIPFEAEKFFSTDGKEVVSIPNALYSEFAEQTVSLTEKMIEAADLEVTSKATLDLVYDQEVEVEGIVSAQAWVKNIDLDTYEGGKVPFAANLLVTVTIEDPSGETPDITMKYTAKSTVDEGKYKLKMRLPFDCWEKNVSVKVKNEPVRAEFTHRYYVTADALWKVQPVDVVYNEMDIPEVALSGTNKVAPVKMSEMIITTRPLDRESVKGIGNPGDAEDGIALNNPFSW